MPRFTSVLAAGVLLVVAGCGDETAPERAARTIVVVGGEEAYRFDAPDGLAECAATPEFAVVRCDIDSVDDDPTRGACVAETAFSFKAGRGEAGFLCVTDSVLAGDARTLVAGDRVRVGPVTCTVTEEPRLRCENRARHGFELRPGTHTLF